MRRWRTRKPSRPLRPLEQIENPVFRAVHPWAFPRVDRSFYERSRAALEELGFRHLADVENVEANREAPRRCRTFISTLLSEPGEVMAGVYQLRAPLLRFLGRRLRGRSRGSGRIIDLASRMGDGTFLVTSNTRGLVPSAADVLGVHQQQFDLETPVRELVAVHHYELSALSTSLGCVVGRLGHLEAVLGAQVELERRRGGAEVGVDRRSRHSR
jgi:hypothetical protein